MPGMTMLEEVGETGLKILLFLYQRRAKFTDFKKDLGAGNEAVYRAVLILERHGLIIERREGKKRMFELSEKGKKVAEKMNEAEKILAEK